MVVIEHLTNRVLTVRRPVLVTDPGGGQSTTWTEVGEVAVRISQPTATERTVAQQDLAQLTHIVYAAPGADVRRGDELADTALTLRVLATLQPSEPVYLRCECEQRQPDGG